MACTDDRYDGQMGIEDVEKNGSGTITGLTRYGLGARGIDVVSRTTSSGNTVSYPLYDAHGNNVGALSKSGSSFVVSDEKSYDAWGGLRSGTNANGKAAYCANLGHKQDDESGLVYMRARYYEPTSGRFVSEDPASQGSNWFTYASLNPYKYVDSTGKVAEEAVNAIIAKKLFELIGLGGLATALKELWDQGHTPKGNYSLGRAVMKGVNTIICASLGAAMISGLGMVLAAGMAATGIAAAVILAVVAITFVVAMAIALDSLTDQWFPDPNK